MRSKEFDQVRERLNDYCDGILGIKGEAYARDEQLEAADRLGNFKRTAEGVGADPLQVAGILLMKHVDALLTWVMEMSEGPSVIRAFVTSASPSSPPPFVLTAGGEPIEGRFADIRNYVDLMFGLAVERAQQVADREDVDEVEGPGPASKFVAVFGPKVTH